MGIMRNRRDSDSSFGDHGRLYGVNNAALAVATLQQKPRLLSKSMFKVRYAVV